MQFKYAALDQIAQFICGDDPLPFPYRSSSKLTTFFTGIGVDYIHRGETRNPWTRETLSDINSKAIKDGLWPSPEMASVIEELMNPTYFEGQEAINSNYEAALTKINRVLKQYTLEVVVDQKSGIVKLHSVDGQFISTAHATPDVVKKITFAPKVFDVPRSTDIQRDLVAIMMPFGQAFNHIHEAIRNACAEAKLRCKRADDIWANSTIVNVHGPCAFGLIL